MDPVRFGRALGFGARAAAKTVIHAVDAATATNPGAKGTASVPTAGSRQSQAIAVDSNPPAARAPRSTSSSAAPARSTIRTAVRTGRGIREGARRFGRESWNPLVRVTGVLWLEFAGVFFGLFALFAATGAWRARTAWHATAANTAEHNRFLGALLMLAVFGYFCVSSFLRARQRARR